MHTIAQQPDPLHAAVASDPAAFLALSDERDTWQRLLAGTARREFDRGFAAGIDEGRRRLDAEDAARHRIVADHVMRLALSPNYARTLIRRWAPPGWRGRLPDGASTHEARLWLARLPRKNDHRPGPLADARVAATWKLP